MSPVTSPARTPDRSAEHEHAFPLVVFFVITFLLAWILWLTAAAATRNGGMSMVARAIFFLPGTFAPGLVALWLTARIEGRTGIDALTARLFRWDVKIRWYLFAVLFIPVVKLSAAVIHRLSTGVWPERCCGPPPHTFSYGCGGRKGVMLWISNLRGRSDDGA